MMERRTFRVMLTGGLVAAPLTAQPQQAGKVARIGFLVPGSLESRETRINLDNFRQGLCERGYVEGQNIVIAYRAADPVGAVTPHGLSLGGEVTASSLPGPRRGAG